MYKNYGTIDTLMDGAELLYTMIKELNDGIKTAETSVRKRGSR